MQKYIIIEYKTIVPIIHKYRSSTANLYLQHQCDDEPSLMLKVIEELEQINTDYEFVQLVGSLNKTYSYIIMRYRNKRELKLERICQ